MAPDLLISSARTEELSEAVRAAIIDTCIEATQEQDFRNLFRYVPSGGWHFLGYEKEALVSHAMVTTRWLQCEGLPLLKTAYIDAVATRPEYQGRGYASALLRYLAGEVDGEYVVACLETSGEAFYRRLGWQSWRGPLAGRSEQGLIPTPGQRGIMVLRLSQTPILDPDSMLTIECQPERIW